MPIISTLVSGRVLRTEATTCKPPIADAAASRMRTFGRMRSMCFVISGSKAKAATTRMSLFFFRTLARASRTSRLSASRKTSMVCSTDFIATISNLNSSPASSRPAQELSGLLPSSSEVTVNTAHLRHENVKNSLFLPDQPPALERQHTRGQSFTAWAKEVRAAPRNDQSTIDRSTSPKSVAGSPRAALRQLKTFRFRFTKGNQLLRPLQFKRREIDAQEIAPAG